MRVLRAGLGLEAAGLVGIIFRAVAADDEVPRGGERVLGQAQGVGTHIGDQADAALPRDLHALVELLGDGHGAPRRHGQAAARLLLQGGGDEGGRGGALLLAALDRADRKGGLLRVREHLVHVLAALELALFLPLAEIAGGKAAAVRAGQQRVEQPVFLADEGLDLLLPVHHHAGGHGLHAPRGQALSDLAPEQRRELVAHDAVEDAARLLGVHEIPVDRAGMKDALGDDLLRDLVEGHAPGLFVRQVQQLLEMPGDRLALAVRVGREIDGPGAFGFLFELVDELRFFAHGDVLRLEAVVYIHAHLALGKIPQMPHGRCNLIIASQILFDRFGLGGRLHDHKVLCFCHSDSYLTFL